MQWTGFLIIFGSNVSVTRKTETKLKTITQTETIVFVTRVVSSLKVIVSFQEIRSQSFD